MSLVSLLRTRTAEAHEQVDAAFGAVDLSQRDDYGRFLTAHARALAAVEHVAGAVYPVRSRMPALSADLDALALPLPDALDPPSAGEAAGWGTLYVIEGSRLGGQLLARRVPAEWPSAYLSSAHLPGEWRAIRAALDAAGEGRDAAWRDAATAAALDTFALYRHALA